MLPLEKFLHDKDYQSFTDLPDLYKKIVYKISVYYLNNNPEINRNLANEFITFYRFFNTLKNNNTINVLYTCFWPGEIHPMQKIIDFEIFDNFYPKYMSRILYSVSEKEKIEDDEYNYVQLEEGPKYHHYIMDVLGENFINKFNKNFDVIILSTTCGKEWDEAKNNVDKYLNLIQRTMKLLKKGGQMFLSEISTDNDQLYKKLVKMYKYVKNSDD